jgi:chaperonin GroEL (HSP60 family)
VLRNFISSPTTVAGGGSAEAAIAKRVREKALSVPGREQIAILRFADALEEIPVTIAKNAGMDEIDTLLQLRAKHSLSNGKASYFGVDAIDRKVKEMLPDVIEPSVVKEQVIKTAVEVTCLLLRVDDVLMARPAMQTHTHDDGTRHTHAGGDKQHAHDHFDRLGKKQRPKHHYY